MDQVFHPCSLIAHDIKILIGVNILPRRSQLHTGVCPTPGMYTSVCGEKGDVDQLMHEMAQCAEYGKLGMMGTTVIYSSGDRGVAGRSGCLNPGGASSSSPEWDSSGTDAAILFRSSVRKRSWVQSPVSCLLVGSLSTHNLS